MARMTDVAQFVSSRIGVPISALLGKDRNKEYVSGRMMVAAIAKNCGESISSIGRFLNKDHSTVLHYLQQGNEDSYSEITREFVDIYGNEETRPESPHHKFKRAFEKYNYRCAVVECSSDEVLEIHHIEPKRLGGKDDTENLLPLCPYHHSLADRGMLYIKGILE